MRAGRRRGAAAALFAFAAAAGCTSVESRYVGQPSHLEEVGGMPIVVQRPRWLKLTYRDVVYGLRRTVTQEVLVESAPTVGEVAPPSGAPIPPSIEWRPATGPAVEYDRLPSVVEVDAEILNVGEVYALDFKRPLFGTIVGDIVFPTKTEATDPKDYQYPKKVGAVVDDQTLKKLNELIPTVTRKLLGITASTKEAPPPADAVQLSSRITCVELYDLRSGSDAPAFCFPAGCGNCGGRR